MRRAWSLNIKSNVIRDEDSKAISKYETLSEVIGYFTWNYLNDPDFLRLVFKPIYELPIPYTTKDAVKNINTVENILSSVKTAKLIDQITIQALEEMQYKCILRRRSDAYTEAWTKHICQQEETTKSGRDNSKSAKRSYLIIEALKRTISQVHFFFD